MDEDIIGLVAVILLFGGGTLFLLSISPIGKAFAARILGKKGAIADDEETADEVKELRREVEEMRERMDFLERLVAEQGEAERLPPVR